MTAARPLNGSGCPKKVRNLAVSVYEIVPSKQEQLELFSSRTHAVCDAMDRIAAANKEVIPKRITRAAHALMREQLSAIRSGQIGFHPCARTGYDDSAGQDFVAGRGITPAVPEPGKGENSRTLWQGTSVPDWLLQPGLLTYPPVTLRVALQAGIPRSGGVYFSERGVSPAHPPP